MRAFYDLNTGRNNGGPIPWRDVVDYASYAGLDAEVTPAFCRILRAMDVAFLGWLDEERGRKERLQSSGTDGQGGKQRRRR